MSDRIQMLFFAWVCVEYRQHTQKNPNRCKNPFGSWQGSKQQSPTADLTHRGFFSSWLKPTRFGCWSCTSACFAKKKENILVANGVSRKNLFLIHIRCILLLSPFFCMRWLYQQQLPQLQKKRGWEEKKVSLQTKKIIDNYATLYFSCAELFYFPPNNLIIQFASLMEREGERSDNYSFLLPPRILLIIFFSQKKTSGNRGRLFAQESREKMRIRPTLRKGWPDLSNTLQSKRFYADYYSKCIKNVCTWLSWQNRQNHIILTSYEYSSLGLLKLATHFALGVARIFTIWWGSATYSPLQLGNKAKWFIWKRWRAAQNKSWRRDVEGGARRD